MTPARCRPGAARPTALTLTVVLVAIMLLALMAPGARAAAVNDPLFARQWDLRQIGAPAAWDRSTGAGVVVGLVDTGVDLGHVDLQGQVLASTNCLGAAGDPAHCKGNGQDDNGHGTHVAGIIAALTNNGAGMASVAPGAKLVVAKALDASGAGTEADIKAGIEWVVNHGAKVVNLSLGDGNVLPLGLSGVPTQFYEGIDYAWQHGAIPVLAAGNNGGGLGSLAGGALGPALGTDATYGSLPAVVVGATGPSGAVAGYSSPLSNDQWGIVAPGGAADAVAADDVVSTYWLRGRSNQYAALAGTSMAAPHVSGALADLLALGYHQQEAVNRLLSTAQRADCGPACAGLLDVANAVGAPATAPSPGSPGPVPAPAPADPLAALLALLGL